MMKIRSGFTIVELLVVIVVIAVLASISIVAYNGIQQRARDSQRLQDAKSIVKALELYKVQFGEYPAAVSSTGQGGWEISKPTAANSDFLSVLRTSGIVSKVPVDPVNTGDMYTVGSKMYIYYRYPASHYGCDASRGAFYVFAVRSGEASNASDQPSFSCGSYGHSGWYVASGFTN